MEIKFLTRTITGLVISMSVFIACNRSASDGITVIDIAGNMNKTLDVKLSDFADSVSYIPLETRPECLVEHGYNFVMVDDLLFVADGQKPLLVFNEKGKYVRSIGDVGNGPGEFREVYQFHVDKEKREIYTFNRNREFLKFSWEGSFIEKIELPHRAIGYERLADGDFYFYSSMQQFSDSVYFKSYFTDSNLQNIKLIPEKQAEQTMYGISVGARIWPGDKVNYMVSEFCDTVYAIADRKLSPEYYLDFGDFRFTGDMLNDRENIEHNLNEYVTAYLVSAAGKYWNISFTLKTFTYLGIVEIENNEISFVREIDTLAGGLVNDIDGGPGFTLYWMSSEKKWYNSLQAIDFIEWYESGAFDKTDIKDREANKRVKKLAAGLKENDNPVIMVVHRKSDPVLW